MKNLCAKLYSKVQTYTGNERGSQALEWIGVAAVIITIVTLLSTAVSSSGAGVDGMVKSIFKKIQDMIGTGG
jgi:Flp pilus assembly pilin Flp